MDKALQAKYANHPLAQAILKDALEIQDRFAAEPVYAKTGKGFLRSTGVEEINHARAADSKKKS